MSLGFGVSAAMLLPHNNILYLIPLCTHSFFPFYSLLSFYLGPFSFE